LKSWCWKSSGDYRRISGADVKNTSIQSRSVIAFSANAGLSDYSADELVLVFEGMCRKNHYTVSDDVRNKLKHILVEAVDSRDEHFGNSRLVRNLFEAAIRRLANRIVNIVPLTHEILTTMHPDDLKSDLVA